MKNKKEEKKLLLLFEPAMMLIKIYCTIKALGT